MYIYSNYSNIIYLKNIYIFKLLKNDIFKIVVFEKFLSKIQIFKSCFIKKTKNLDINKVYKKNYLIIKVYNKKKTLYYHNCQIYKYSAKVLFLFELLFFKVSIIVTFNFIYELFNIGILK